MLADMYPSSFNSGFYQNSKVDNEVTIQHRRIAMQHEHLLNQDQGKPLTKDRLLNLKIWIETQTSTRITANDIENNRNT